MLLKEGSVKKECCLTVLLAWALWTNGAVGTTPNQIIPWIRIEEFETNEQCVPRINDWYIKNWQKGAQKEGYAVTKGITTTADGVTTSVSLNIGNKLMVVYYCLPDTIDPRK